jgi:2-dehydro-3-deoxyphosphooctonate aldolase (KDO 8-P synthase)
MNKQIKVKIKDFEVSNEKQFTLFAGPCLHESTEHALFISDSLAKICKKLGINFVYKSSFDKANRSSAASTRSFGIENTLKAFNEVRNQVGCPIITDVHTAEQCAIVADYIDVIQIPAFLCRQTDLIAAACATKKVVNIKKGQFLSPWDAKNLVEKPIHFGHDQIMITERGSSFGYNNLVVDMRALAIMAEFGAPVIFDATHSVQKPGGLGHASGGERKFAPVLAKAAISVGVAGIFMEVHQDPDNAPSDGPNMIILDDVEQLLAKLLEFDKIAKSA